MPLCCGPSSSAVGEIDYVKLQKYRLPNVENYLKLRELVGFAPYGSTRYATAKSAGWAHVDQTVKLNETADGGSYFEGGLTHY